jgi:iduronate 2-sulfatase
MRHTPTFLRTLALVLPVLPAVGICPIAAAAPALARPNVLLICVDDLKPLLGCYGNKTIKSPNIDRLAARGVVFDRAYCNQAVCAPSRNTLLTGVRPSTTGIYDLATNFRAAAQDTVTLPQNFMRGGWRTEALGKIFHVGHGNHEDPASWSVPHWGVRSIEYVLKERHPDGLTREEALFSNQPAANLPRGAAWENPDVPDEAYSDGRLAAEAIRRLQDTRTRPETPFFLAVGFVKPHLPFCAPKKYWDLYDPAQLPLAEHRTPPEGAPAYSPQFGGELRQYSGIPGNGPLPDDLQRTLIHGYHATVSFMDAQLGKVLDELDRLRLADKTIIVLWGDHGWHLGDHSMWCKHTNYEEATRIPLIICAPGITKAGTHAGAMVETLDLYPTLNELAGRPAPDGPLKLEGQSLVPSLRNPDEPGKNHILHVFPRNKPGTGPVIGRAIRTKTHRLVEWKAPGAPPESADLELYDYEKDPLETKNLAAEQPQLAARLQAMLKAHGEAKPQLRLGKL